MSEDDIAYMSDEDGDVDEFSEGFDDPLPFSESTESLAASAESALDHESPSYEVLTEEEMLHRLDTVVSNYASILGNIPPPIVCCLLRAYSWNGENMINAFTEDPDAALATAHLPSLSLYAPPAAGSCPICLDDFAESDSFALSCGHHACRSCWQSYLQAQIADGPDCVFATCMTRGCFAVVHDAAFSALVSPTEFARYRTHLAHTFVAAHPKLKWCPAPNCSFVVSTETGLRREAVQCRCGASWCFRCADYFVGDHMPAKCSQVDMWRQKASDESENVNWIIANTKKCPKCGSPIEKNGGCMHMTCSRNAGGCGFDFCWLCRGAWADHGSHTGGYYSCNKYDSSKAKEEDVKSSDAKTELEHYMFYYHRYESHRGALKIAGAQREQAARRASDILEKFAVRSTDVNFLMEAAEQLVTNRRVLQWSYVYAFYLSGEERKTERNLFEYLQEDVEKHTNHLSNLYEKPLSKIATYQEFMAWKAEVTNYSGTCRNFLSNFVKGVANGLTT